MSERRRSHDGAGRGSGGFFWPHPQHPQHPGSPAGFGRGYQTNPAAAGTPLGARPLPCVFPYPYPGWTAFPSPPPPAGVFPGHHGFAPPPHSHLQTHPHPHPQMMAPYPPQYNPLQPPPDRDPVFHLSPRRRNVSAMFFGVFQSGKSATIKDILLSSIGGMSNPTNLTLPLVRSLQRGTQCTARLKGYSYDPQTTLWDTEGYDGDKNYTVDTLDAFLDGMGDGVTLRGWGQQRRVRDNAVDLVVFVVRGDNLEAFRRPGNPIEVLLPFVKRARERGTKVMIVTTFIDKILPEMDLFSRKKEDGDCVAEIVGSVAYMALHERIQILLSPSGEGESSSLLPNSIPIVPMLNPPALKMSDSKICWAVECLARNLMSEMRQIFQGLKNDIPRRQDLDLFAEEGSPIECVYHQGTDLHEIVASLRENRRRGEEDVDEPEEEGEESELGGIHMGLREMPTIIKLRWWHVQFQSFPGRTFRLFVCNSLELRPQRQMVGLYCPNEGLCFESVDTSEVDYFGLIAQSSSDIRYEFVLGTESSPVHHEGTKCIVFRFLKASFRLVLRPSARGSIFRTVENRIQQSKPGRQQAAFVAQMKQMREEIASLSEKLSVTEESLRQSDAALHAEVMSRAKLMQDMDQLQSHFRLEMDQLRQSIRRDAAQLQESNAVTATVLHDDLRNGLDRLRSTASEERAKDTVKFDRFETTVGDMVRACIDPVHAANGEMIAEIETIRTIIREDREELRRQPARLEFRFRNLSDFVPLQHPQDFLNQWRVFDGPFHPPGYLRDCLGLVRLQGVMQAGTYDQPAFQLPQEMRPPRDFIFPAAGDQNVTVMVRVQQDGMVVPQNGGVSTMCSLDGIVFPSHAPPPPPPPDAE